ncbi:MAG: hypothetical protein AAGI24_02020 [Pseudomonadota bacterium]
MYRHDSAIPFSAPVLFITLALVAFTLLASPPGSAQGAKPRYMSAEAGWVDEATDTRVESVTRNPEDGSYRVEISMPQIQQAIEEVLVVGQRPTGPDISMPVEYEVINDLDSGRRGIVLYLGSDEPFGLQVNYQKGTPQMADPKDPGLTIR